MTFPRAADQQRENTVCAYRIVIVQILVTECQTVHALRNQPLHTVLDAVRVAVIDKTPGEPREHPQSMVDLS
jgi:hypothetical protein